MAYEIDPELRPSTTELPSDEYGRRPLAVVEDARGVRAEFVATELIVESKAELEAILAQTGGTVVGSDEVPEPPPGLEGTRDVDRSPRMWVIRVDPLRYPLDSFDADTEALGLSGGHRVSSDEGARLLAIAASLRRKGRAVALNFTAQPTRLPITSSTEGFGLDAFTLTEFQSTGPKSSVTQAWQFMQAYQLLRPTGRVRVAIIDSGFWLNPDGTPRSAEGGRSDLPPRPIQYDFIGDDYVADGMNTVANGQGGVPPWHGNGSASVATAVLNNATGAVGTGGLVAEPVLFKTDFTVAHNARAVRTTTAWGCHVANMSFAGAKNWWWRTFSASSYHFAFEEARILGVILVAGAGNGDANSIPQDVDDNDIYPCTLSGVIGVGAIDNSANAMPYSNFGGSVDIWAPTNILAMPDGVSTQPTHTGTSAAAPFIAGIAAMVSAIDPRLGTFEVADILTRTAWRDSTNPKVSAYVNAYAAVIEAAEKRLPPDRFDPNGGRSTATDLQLTNGTGKWETLAISASDDRDWFRFSIDDYSSLTVDVNFVSSLAGLDLDVFTDDPGLGLGVEGEWKVSTPTGRQYHADLIGAGVYYVIVRGNGANVYDLSITTAPAMFRPDEFEVNDTFETAASLPAKPLGHWMRKANLHTTADVDYYKLDGVRLAGPVAFDFQIVASDMDLTMRLFDQGGVERDVTGPTRTPVLDIGSGTSVIKVEGGGRRGRYLFGYGYRLTDSHIIDGLGTRYPLFYDPGDPGPRWLIGPEEYLVFSADERLAERDRRLDLLTSNRHLHMALLTASGEVLAEGERSLGGEVEEIALERLRPPQQYAVRVWNDTPSSGLGRLIEAGGPQYELWVR
jgi:hypothetical protein